MKIVIGVILAYLLSINSIFAGEIYTYTDKNGNTVLSNTPIPDKYKSKARKVESYQRDSQQDIERFQQQQKTAAANSFRVWKEGQIQKQPSSSRKTEKDSPNVKRAYVDNDPGWLERKLNEQKLMQIESENKRMQNQIDSIRMDDYLRR